MKKIAFFVQWMLCAGVENALITLSDKLVKSGNDVTIYVIKEKGEFLKKIPEGVKLKAIPMEESVRKTIPVGGTTVTVRECIHEKQYLRALNFLVKHKLSKTEFAELNINLENIPNLNEQYDIAVNFHMHSPFLVWYFSKRVNTPIKYTWIHNDFETTGYNIAKLKQYLDCVDHFFAVSDQLTKEFINIFSEFKDKTTTAFNIIPSFEIKEKANEYYPKEYKDNRELKLLTVGRLEEQKGYDIAIKVCTRLIKDGLKFKWYVLGEGTQRKTLEEKIQKENIQDTFKLLGVRMNPYPYFKNCDIYVQTSKHEGYVTTVTEAKILNKPIMTTDVSGAKEQLQDGTNGSIAEINVESVYTKLKELMKSKELRQKYITELESNKEESKVEWLSFFE